MGQFEKIPVRNCILKIRAIRIYDYGWQIENTASNSSDIPTEIIIKGCFKRHKSIIKDIGATNSQSWKDNNKR